MALSSRDRDIIADVFRQFQQGITTVEEFKEQLAALDTAIGLDSETMAKAADAIKTQTGAMAGATAAVNVFSSVVQNWQTAFAAAADLMYGNINELVNYYNAQINAISAQNSYTQALALQAEATQIYGAGSEQASRATTAATYVGALYTQSKEQEVVAYENYITATAQNLATMAQAIMNLIVAIQTFVAVSQVLGAEELLGPFGALVGLAVGGGIYAAATTQFPHLQGGGHVTSSGLAYLHGGESIVPAGGMGASNGNVEIHIHASSNMDMGKITQTIEQVLARRMLEAQKQRGVY